jgi:hypothetical protein
MKKERLQDRSLRGRELIQFLKGLVLQLTAQFGNNNDWRRAKAGGKKVLVKTKENLSPLARLRADCAQIARHSGKAGGAKVFVNGQSYTRLPLPIYFVRFFIW